MAGKLDQASHDAAIARIAEALAHADVIRAHLREILNGAAFKGSRRSQEFLKHVVECALGGQWERLKERSLGMDVFSRDATYDTGGDSIVRVTASDVRRRLMQHYAEYDGTAGCRIEIPAGSYIPEFAGFDELTRAMEAHKGNGRGSGGRWKRHAAARGTFLKVALLLAMIQVGWALGMVTGRLVWGAAAKPESRYAFYRELLGPLASDSAHETEIALSNPRLLLYLGSDRSTGPLWPSRQCVRVPPELEKMLNPTANDVQAKYPFHFLTLADEDYTGIGEAMSAFNLGQLMRRIDRPLHLTEARFLNWGAARNVHLVLLGAPHMSSWVEESLGRSNFTMEHEGITNAQPLAGERKVYNRSADGNGFEDYGLIWMARLPSGLRQLLIAGLTSAGTAGVGDFFCDPERMGPVYEKLRAASGNGPMPANWQVLLHIHARENVPLEVNFVALRADGAKR